MCWVLGFRFWVSRPDGSAETARIGASFLRKRRRLHSSLGSHLFQPTSLRTLLRSRRELAPKVFWVLGFRFCVAMRMGALNCELE